MQFEIHDTPSIKHWPSGTRFLNFWTLHYIQLTLGYTFLSCTSFFIPQKTCFSRPYCTTISTTPSSTSSTSTPTSTTSFDNCNISTNSPSTYSTLGNLYILSTSTNASPLPSTLINYVFAHTLLPRARETHFN